MVKLLTQCLYNMYRQNKYFKLCLYFNHCYTCGAKYLNTLLLCDVLVRTLDLNWEQKVPGLNPDPDTTYFSNLTQVFDMGTNIQLSESERYFEI